MAESELITHKIRGMGRPIGAAAIVTVLGCMAVGPSLPFVALIMLWYGWSASGWALIVFLALPFVFKAPWSPLVCQFYLQAAGWFRHGVTLHLEKDAVDAIDKNPCMWCMHPHGTSIGFGFSLNGAIRFKALQPKAYVPVELSSRVSPERLSKISGIQAPALFRLPMIRPMLHMFGASTPATKAGLLGLLRNHCDLGILPGGMEEVALYKKGHERVYIRHRAGFIKYALQHGYLMVPAYTFGECDCYTSLGGGWLLDLMQKRLGVILPVFWGPRWWCPLLPDPEVAVHTVVGNQFKLPQISEPTAEEVREYHELYMSKLTDLYNRYKGRFGHPDRELELY